MRIHPASFQPLREWLSSLWEGNNTNEITETTETKPIPIPVTHEQTMHELLTSQKYLEMVTKFRDLPELYTLTITNKQLTVSGGNNSYEVDLGYIVGDKGAADTIWIILSNLEKIYKSCSYKYRP